MRFAALFGMNRAVGCLENATHAISHNPVYRPTEISSCYKGEGSSECNDGRQHQSVDGEAEKGPCC